MITLIIQAASFRPQAKAGPGHSLGLGSVSASSGTAVRAGRTPSATTFPPTPTSLRCPRTMWNPRLRATSGWCACLIPAEVLCLQNTAQCRQWETWDTQSFCQGPEPLHTLWPSPSGIQDSTTVQEGFHIKFLLRDPEKESTWSLYTDTRGSRGYTLHPLTPLRSLCGPSAPSRTHKSRGGDFLRGRDLAPSHISGFPRSHGNV